MSGIQIERRSTEPPGRRMGISVRPSVQFLMALAFLALLPASMLSRSPVLYAAYAGVALALVLLNARCIGFVNARDGSAIGLVVLALTVMLPLSALRNYTAVVHYGMGLTSLACAYVLTRSPESLLRASFVTLASMQVALLGYLLIAGLDDLPLDRLLSHTSSNGITSALLAMQISYSVLNFLVRRRTSLLMSVATLTICVAGYGRGSILVAAGVLVVSIAALFSGRRTWRVAISVVVVGALVVLATTYRYELTQFVMSNTKIGTGLRSDPRERMIADYIDRIDGGSLFIGASYRGTSIESEFNGNPHNSYIRAHHLFGLPYLVAVLLFPLMTSLRRSDFDVRLHWGCMVALLLTRSFTEPLLFPTAFDFFYFAICFSFSGATTGQPKSKGELDPALA